MVECQYKLSIRFKDGEEEVVLPLWPEAVAPTVNEIGLLSIEADASVYFVLQGIVAPRAAIALSVGDMPIPVAVYDTSDGLHLSPIDPQPFAETIGLAKVKISVNLALGETEVYEAMPVRVCLKPGPVAENLAAMSEAVDTLHMLFGTDALQSKDLDEALEARRKLMHAVEDFYDRYYPYFREEPRHKLSTVVTRQNIERLREVTPATMQWIATHPYELQQVPQGTGIRSQGRAWMPRHVPMRTVVQDRDIVENRAVLGFVARLADEAKQIVRQLTDVEENPEDVLARAKASRLLMPQIRDFEALSERLQRLATLYQDALGVPMTLLQQLPAPTAHFLETAQYRRVYEYMCEWFKLAPVDLEKIVQRLMSVTSPKLYEYFSLVTFLKGLHAEGFELTDYGLHVYEGAGDYYMANRSQQVQMNTFGLTNAKRNETVRLWYEPVVGGLPAPGETPPNGLGLFRATSWSMNSRDGTVLEASENGWYWPDFVVSLEVDGRTAWAIVDSKYSTINTVIRYYGVSQVFKYLMSLRPIKAEDVFAGLWLWCGSVTPDTSPEGSFFDVAQSGGIPMTPDLTLRRLNGLTTDANSMVSEIVERLRQVLKV